MSMIFENSFLISDDIFMIYEDTFLIDENVLLIYEDTFLIDENAYLIHQDTFLIDENAFLIYEDTFLIPLWWCREGGCDNDEALPSRLLCRDDRQRIGNPRNGASSILYILM